VDKTSLQRLGTGILTAHRWESPESFQFAETGAGMGTGWMMIFEHMTPIHGCWKICAFSPTLDRRAFSIQNGLLEWSRNTWNNHAVVCA